MAFSSASWVLFWLPSRSRMKAQAQAWLREHGIPHYVPRALPSEVYADASHPLAEGYGMLAGKLLKNDAFILFAGNREAPQ